MAPSLSGSKKRPFEMVVYDPAAAAANKRARDDGEDTSTSSTSTSSSSSAAALFLLASSASAPPPFADLEEPISAVPISAVPPPQSQLPPVPVAVPVAGREEPPCLRKHFLLALGLRADLPVHFIDAKRVTATDLDPHQNRLRIPNGAIHRLRPLLTPAELHEANLFFLPDDPPKPKRRPGSGKHKQQQPQPAAEPQNDGGGASSSMAAAETTKKKIKKPKAKGKVHGGLRVKLVNLDAGASSKDLLLSRWESSRGTVVKGEGYLDFIHECGFKAMDPIEVWAFVQRRFRIFGKDIFGDSLLHVLVVKKDDEHQPQQRCRYCRPPPAPAANPSIMSS